MKFLRSRHAGLCVMLWCFTNSLLAQDTTYITLHQAESMFIEKNLSLLAEKYNINMAEAEIIQARLYPNPNVSVTGNLYNPELRKVADVSNRTGDYEFSAQQLILLAGKRNKQVKMAQTGLLISKDGFYDLLRTLMYSLRSTFYKASYLHHSISAFQQQIDLLEKLNRSYEQSQKNGSVTLYDAVRIRSMLYSIRAEQMLMQNEFNDLLSDLRMLIQADHSVYIPLLEPERESRLQVSEIMLNALVDTALAHRADLRQARNMVTYSRQNYTYEKSLAVPDITIGASYERRGGFVENASFLTLSMDIPFLNRNQGKIKAAKFAIDQSTLLSEMQLHRVESEVRNAYLNLLNTDKMLKSIDPDFSFQLQYLLQSVTQNFEKGNISLLEFTDFYDSYKQSLLNHYQIQNEHMQAMELVNYACGKIVLDN